MDPTAALNDLARGKHALRTRIGARRARIAQATAPVLVTLAWCDVAWLAWRRLPVLAKLVAAPTAVSIAAQLILRGRWRRAQRWLPLAVAVFRLIRAGAWGRGSGRRSRDLSHAPSPPINARTMAQSAEPAAR